MDSPCATFCYRKNKPNTTNSICKTKTIKLIFFDMDGVLTDTYSSWKYIHDHFKTSNERSVDAYLKGTIDDQEFIRRDVSLWKEHGKHTKKETLQNILSEIPLMHGSKQCLAFLHKHHIQTAIVSAGLDILAEKVAADLNIPYVFANGVCQDEDGILTGDGIVNVQLKHKEKNVQQLAQQLDIPLEQCVAVGNSCFDISMFETCGFSIAFNPDDACVRDAADAVVEGKDLRRILQVLRPLLA